MSEQRHQLRRKFVGVCRSHPHRRDFVRVQGAENNTCLSIHLNMFVTLSGFFDDPSDGFVLPTCYRDRGDNINTLELALVRWLSPHPDALLRDSKLRPICKPPMDINHALWTYSTRPVDRDLHADHLQFYDGNTEDEKKKCFLLETRAYFDLIQPDSFVAFMNCTRIDTITSDNVILETITLPFEEMSYDI